MTLPVQAGDWSLESRLSGKEEFDDNYQLLTDPDGYVFVSTAGVFGDLIYKGHHSRLDLIADIVARSYMGPGSDNLVDNVFPNLEAKYRQEGKRTDFELGAGYSLEYLPAGSQAEGLDVVGSSSDTIRSSLTAGGNVTHRVNLRNSLVFAASAAQTTFDGEGTNNFSTESSAAWNRRLTKRTDGSLVFGFDTLTLEDDEDTERYVYSARTSVASKLSNRLSVNAGAGINLVDSYRTDLLAIGTPRVSELNLGYSLEAGLEYRLKTTSFSLKASYGLEPGALGDLEDQASIYSLATKTINERSSVSLAAGAEMTQGFSNGNNVTKTYGLFISPTYSLALTDEWDLQAGYRFLLKDTEDGTATSNNVFLSLSRDFVAVP